MLSAEEMKDARQMVLGILDQVNKGSRGIYYVMYKMDYFNLHLKDWPEVREWLDGKKDQLIRDLLANLKEGRDGQSTADFTLTRMRKIGLDWPELNIIERSLHADRPDLKNKEVDEAEKVQTTTDKIMMSMLRLMEEGKPFALENAITQLENLDYGDREILKFLSKHDENISDWADDLLASNAGHNRYRQLDQVMNLVEIGATWPSLISVLNKHKDVIVRHMLTHLSKAGEDMEWIIDNMDGWCKKLRKAGISWPELNVIEKSVDRELTRIVGRYDVDEQHDIDKRLARNVSKPLSRWISDEVKEKVENYMMGTQGTMALRRLATDLADYSLTPEEMERFTRDARKFFHADLARKLKHMVSVPLGDMVALNKIGLFDDRMRELLNGAREMIVRGLLLTAKDEGVHRAYHVGVEPLKSFGIDWPELDAIEKSHASEYKRQKALRDKVEEGFDDMGSDTFTDNLMDKIDRKQWESVFHDMAFRYEGFNSARIRKLLNANKHGMVKGLLEMLSRYGNKGHMEDLDYIFSNLMPVLEGLKLGWSELEVIKKSWWKDAQKRLNADDDLDEAAKVSNMTPKRWQNIADRGVDTTRQNGHSAEMRYMADSLLSNGAPVSAVDELLMLNIEVLTHVIKKELESGYIDNAFATMGFMQRFEKTHQTLVGLTNDHLGSIKKGMLRMLGYGDVASTVALLNRLKHVGIDPKLIKGLKAEVGPKIISVIKDMINNNGFGRHVFDAMAALESMGIKPSIGTGKIRDRLLSDFDKTLATAGMMTVGWQSESNANIFIKLAIRYGDADTLERMKGLIEKNKDQVIKTMLQAFRNKSEYNIYPALSSLQNLGFKWPELAIIDKSVKSMPGAR